MEEAQSERQGSVTRVLQAHNVLPTFGAGCTLSMEESSCVLLPGRQVGHYGANLALCMCVCVCVCVAMCVMEDEH